MFNWVKRSILLLLSPSLLVAVAPTIPSKADDETGFPTQEIENKVIMFSENILAEIDKLGNHPWAGQYFLGDEKGEYVYTLLTLAPENGFSFTYEDSSGPHHHGSIDEKDGHLILTFTSDQDQKSTLSFTVVPWDERVYLIPPDEIVEFCNEINQGREPRNSVSGLSLLRKGGEQKPVTGKPLVPDEYMPYIFDGPIETSITSIGEYSFHGPKMSYQFKDTLVTLDKGKKEGLLPGMEFYIDGSHFDRVVVKEISEHTSTAVITQWPSASYQSPSDYPEIMIGWKFQSRAWFYQ